MLLSLDYVINVQKIVLEEVLLFEAHCCNQANKKPLTKFIKMKDKFDLCNTWRINNTKTQKFTFR